MPVPRATCQGTTRRSGAAAVGGLGELGRDELVVADADGNLEVVAEAASDPPGGAACSHAPARTMRAGVGRHQTWRCFSVDGGAGAAEPIARQSVTLHAVERRHGRLAVTVAAVAYSWWVAGLAAFTWPATVAVAAAGVAFITLGIRRPRPAGPDVGAPHNALAWAILFALLAGWELAAYLQQPRADHPTLSALADQTLDWRPARALAFLAWMAVGAAIARR